MLRVTDPSHMSRKCHESVTNVRSRARQLNYHNIPQWGSDCKITFVVVRLRLRFQCTLTLYVTIYDERLDLGSDKSHFSDRRATLLAGPLAGSD